MQEIKIFYTKYKRALSAIVGILMITGAIATLYWSNSSGLGSKENTKASKSIERMKAKGLLGGSSSSGKSKKSSPKSLMSSYMEKKSEQNRVFLIILAIGGALALLYSFFSKKDDKSLSAK